MANHLCYSILRDTISCGFPRAIVMSPTPTPSSMYGVCGDTPYVSNVAGSQVSLSCPQPHSKIDPPSPTASVSQSGEWHAALGNQPLQWRP